MPRHRSDSDTHLIYWEATVDKPEATKVTDDARLLVLNDRATIAMRSLCKRFRIDPKGHAFWNPPAPDEARDALLAWIADLSQDIADHGLSQAAIDAIYPVPMGVDHHACHRLFLATELPAMADLIHVLFAIGLSSGAVTGAALLLHRAQNPTGRIQIRDGEVKEGTSGTRRKLKV